MSEPTKTSADMFAEAIEKLSTALLKLNEMVGELRRRVEALERNAVSK